MYYIRNANNPKQYWHSGLGWDEQELATQFQGRMMQWVQLPVNGVWIHVEDVTKKGK